MFIILLPVRMSSGGGGGGSRTHKRLLDPYSLANCWLTIRRTPPADFPVYSPFTLFATSIFSYT